MKDFPGTPGSLTGFFLRISQSLFAVGSIASMATTSKFFQYTAFCYLIASMSLQFIWSFGLAILDAYTLVKKRVSLHNNNALVGFFVVGDWITATLSLGGASASAGITIFFCSDLAEHGFIGGCAKYQLSFGLAFLSWVFIATSSFIMLWLLAETEA